MPQMGRGLARRLGRVGIVFLGLGMIFSFSSSFSDGLPHKYMWSELGSVF